MESVWYYVVNGAQVGPVSLAELKDAAATGKLTPPDLVWKEGTADWVPARTVPELFPATPPRPPVPAPSDPSGPPAPTYSLSPPLAPPPLHPASVPAPAAGEPLSLDDEGGKHARPRRRDEQDADGRATRAPEWVKLIPVFLERTFDPNPARLAPIPDEETALTRSGVMDVTARKFAVWRRAVLFVAAVPCGVAALLALIHLLALDQSRTELFSSFGMFVQYVHAFSLFALPVAAAFGALAYDRLAVSATWVLIGTLVSFVVPLGVAFVPGEWMLDTQATGSTTVEELEWEKARGRSTLALLFSVMLVPVVLSLLPAVARACVRMKLFLPESPVPGWALVASAPLCILLTLAALVPLYHIAGNVLLLIALVLWIGSPLVFFTKFNLLTRPISSPADQAAIARTALVVFGLIVLGILLLLIDLAVARVQGRAVVGFDRSTSLLRPWSLEIHKRLFEYAGRSLFVSVFFADLLLRAALSVWREERAFAGTPESASLDRAMSGLNSAILPRGGGRS